MAGLAAASVLSKHVERVTVLERDALPAGASDRPGVPQGFHQHVLLAEGRHVLERLFPGLDADLGAAGAEPVAWGRDVLIFAPKGRVRGFDGEILTRPCTRALLEHAVRQRVRAQSNITWMERCEAVGLGTSRPGRVERVVVRSRDNGHERVLEAGLVVDTTGRRSQLPGWLNQLGYAAPPETVVNPFLGYATRRYRRIPQSVTGWKAIEMSTRAPDVPRAAGIWPAEDDQWIVTLVGTSRDYPPVDEAGFLEFSRGLIDPVVHEFLTRAEPLSEIRGYRRTENRWRRYDRLQRFPDRLLVMGDAVCCFNPIYGQGMTAAALQAELLDQLLRRAGRRSGGLEGALHAFRHRVAGIIESAWLLATSEDYRWPATEGPPLGLMERLGYLYTDWMLETAVHHGEVVQAFLEVSHMLRRPASVLRPSVSRLVIGHVLATRLRRTAGPGSAGHS